MITFAKHTDIGERNENEDSIKCLFSEENGHSFVVADGLGGHGRGKDASNYAVEIFEEEFKEKQSMLDYLKSCFKKTEEKLVNEQDKTKSIMELKTTAVALTIKENKAQWGHIGDSRLYLFEKGKMKLRTLDHSLPQMLVFAKEIKEKHIRNHPDRNRLLRVLGSRSEELKVDYSEEIEIKNGQAFLLCSDGFWECITERKMCKFLKKSNTPEEWLEKMIEEVKKNGKGSNMDNNSAIVVFVDDK